MADENTRSPRRRPVDLLFGEEVQLKPAVPDPEPKPATPGYMVEPPRPVTSVRPPPPEFPNDWHASAPPEPAAVVETPVEPQARPDPVTLPPKPPKAELPAPPVAEAVTFTTPPEDGSKGQPRRAQAFEPPMPIFVPQTQPPPPTPQPVTVAPTAPPSPYGQIELLELSQFVDQLYQNVADETSDSRALNAECLKSLNAARVAIEKRDYSQAEASAEYVKARLLRARSSRAAAALPTTRLLFAGLFFAALVGIVLFALPFVLRIVPVVIPLLRGGGLGMLGGSAAALFQLRQIIARHEYDTAFNTGYALSPLFGALTGAVIYLLSLLGIVAAPNALGLTFEPFALMYLFALLGGFYNDAILSVLRGWVRRK